jgi:hypothetical protein
LFRQGEILAEPPSERAGPVVAYSRDEASEPNVSFFRRIVMKWTGMYLLGYVVLIAGLLAGLWHLGVLASIGTTWTLIGVVIAIGIGIMVSVSSSGTKENIEIARK